ncbi:hypothetical protein G5V57_17985 [Nordella sp. HKS 07]|uniref:hypothetical protein n=1 Tax=Nordella sp. HKS 07 TaxID=2712222 RepID=UPI0013E18B61|nr:hypothetical protein [Nordella sp. HKS 07]QIG49440.1 hypothetical protein G5V57_17985 [Nordella sp. HKS 07]
MADDAGLERVSITFHTNDEDKDTDTHVEVSVEMFDNTVVAILSDDLGHFDDNSDAGPFFLEHISPTTRGAMKSGHVSIKSVPNGDDTWRFNFLLNLQFQDGSHLIARANGLELSETLPKLSFGIE